MTYILNILISIDQVFNALLGGYPDETLSSRAYRKHGTVEKIINVIMFFQPDHCRKAYDWEKQHRDQPPEMRG